MNLFKVKGQPTGFEKIFVDASTGCIDIKEIMRKNVKIRETLPTPNEGSDDSIKSLTPELQTQASGANDSGLGGFAPELHHVDENNNMINNDSRENNLATENQESQQSPSQAVSTYYQSGQNSKQTNRNAGKSVSSNRAPAKNSQNQTSTCSQVADRGMRGSANPEQTMSRRVNITKDPIEHTLSNTGDSEFMRFRISRAMQVKKGTQLVFETITEDVCDESSKQTEIKLMHTCHVCGKTITKKQAKDHAVRHGNDFYYDDCDDETTKVIFITVPCPAKNNPCGERFLNRKLAAEHCAKKHGTKRYVCGLNGCLKDFLTVTGRKESLKTFR